MTQPNGVDESKFIEALALLVPKTKAQTTLMFLRRKKLLYPHAKIAIMGDNVALPILRGLTRGERMGITRITKDYVLNTMRFSMREPPWNWIDAVTRELPVDLRPLVPHSLDFIGKIMVVALPLKLEPYDARVGEALLKTHRNMRTVLAKTGPVKGWCRLGGLKLIAGSPNTETIHREYGCKFIVDPRKVYFNPRLAVEHHRLAMEVCEDETVVDMFCGVGCFAIHIAKNLKNVKVYAVDKNPAAYEFLMRNIVLNRVENSIVAVCGDAEKTAHDALKNIADRVIMNLPSRSLSYVSAASACLKPGEGVIHLYIFTSEEKPWRKLAMRVKEKINLSPEKKLRNLKVRKVRDTAPRESMVAVEVKVA